MKILIIIYLVIAFILSIFKEDHIFSTFLWPITTLLTPIREIRKQKRDKKFYSIKHNCGKFIIRFDENYESNDYRIDIGSGGDGIYIITVSPEISKEVLTDALNEFVSRPMIVNKEQYYNSIILVQNLIK